MEKVTTAFNGITSNPVYQEGDCLSLVNLRPKNGALIPVPERREVGYLSGDYDIVFIHSNSGYENWIGVGYKNGISSVYAMIDSAPILMGTIDSKVISVEQTGNILSFVSNESITYAIFRDGKYDFLGVVPELPAFHLESYSEGALSISFKLLYGDNTTNKSSFVEHTSGLVNKAIDIIVNGGTDIDGSSIEGVGIGNWLFDAHIIRFAYRMYDGTLVKPSAPILVMASNKHILDYKTIRYSFDGDTLNASSKINVFVYNLWVSCKESVDPRWRDLIQSVDLFVSPPMGLSNIEYLRKDLPIEKHSLDHDYRLIKEYPPEAIANIESNSLFYYVQSFEYPTGGAFNVARAFPDLDDEKSRIGNLAAQELMADSNMSNHKYAAGCSYNYNSRLHIAGIKTKMFDGWAPDGFLWLGERYNGATGVNYLTPGNDMIAEIEIETVEGAKKVYRRSTPRSGTGNLSLRLTPFLSYPDTRAKRLNLYAYTNQWIKCFSCELRPHKTMNVAYYLNESLYPITGGTFTSSNGIENKKSDAVIFNRNQVKVSELNNPFVFPNKNTYQVGNGSVMGLATNAMNVADRNYGQHPLYVFTSQGIWTLNVGDGEVVYSVLSTPTYPEAPTTGVLCSTPYGVVFTAPNGLMLINGQSTNLLSPQLKEEMPPFEMEIPPGAGDVHNFAYTPFDEYLRGIDNIAYDPHEQEVILSNKSQPFDYVLSMRYQQFYMSTHRFRQMVKNYPSGLLVIYESGSIRDYVSPEDEPVVAVSFILRPLSFGTNEIKRLDRMVLRGNIHNGNLAFSNGMTIMTHHSNDGNFFHLTRGLRKGDADRKDIDMGLFARSKWRHFVVSFGALVEGKSKLFCIDTMIEKEYTNTKMR